MPQCSVLDDLGLQVLVLRVWRPLKYCNRACLGPCSFFASQGGWRMID